MSNFRELVLGCGSRTQKDARLVRWMYGGAMLPTGALDYVNATRLDINADHKPDVQFNLERIDGATWNRIPALFGSGTTLDGNGLPIRAATPDNFYDEIHAYEVLEHICKQGDYRKHFAQFAEFHRVLKPNGLLYATCPSFASPWAWGDPSHTRVLTEGGLVFLSQEQYRVQVGVTPMSDFRYCYKADFDTLFAHEDADSLIFILRAIK